MTTPTPRFALALTALFAIACGVGLARHEIWLDEAQAWLIGSRAGDLAQLRANLVYEGHPPLWYMLIFAVSRVWPAPEAMQALSWLFATATVALVAWRAPLTPLQKGLFAFGYFPLFEYGVIARSYGLGMCLLVAYSALRWAGVRRLALLALPLALAAQTSIFALIVAWALAVALALERLDAGPEARPTGVADAVGAALLLGGSTLAALRFMLPPADGSFDAPWVTWYDAARVAWSGYAPLWGFFPLPAPLDPRPWNSSWLVGGLGLGQLGTALGAFVVLAAGLALAGRPAALVGWAAGVLVLFAFSYLKHAGSLRHHGHFFLLWLTLLWTAAPAGPQARAIAARLAARFAPLATPTAGPAIALAVAAAVVSAAWHPLGPFAGPLLLCALLLAAAALAGGWLPGLVRAARGLEPGGKGLTALLALHVVACAQLWLADATRPFSGSRALAERVVGTPEARLPLYVADATQTNQVGPTLAALLGTEATFVAEQGDTRGSFLVWDGRRPPFRGTPTAEDRLRGTQLAAWRLAGLLRPGERALFATEAPLPEFPPGLRAGLLALGPRAVASDEPEPLALYLVEGDPAQGRACPREP